jgi:hypothetical protein
LDLVGLSAHNIPGPELTSGLSLLADPNREGPFFSINCTFDCKGKALPYAIL